MTAAKNFNCIQNCGQTTADTDMVTIVSL